MDCYQDCNNTGNRTSTQGIPHLFNIDNPFDYVIFPIEPTATDLHIATYTNGTAYFVYSGDEWILDNYKDQQVFPDCMPPCEHFHTLSDVVGLSNYLDTLDSTLTSFLDTLGDLQDQVDTIIVPSYTHPNHTGDVTSVGDGPTTIANEAVTAAKLATTGVTAGTYVNANINVNNKGQIVSATNGLQPIKSDWNAVSGLAEILNKPTIPPVYTHPNHTGDVTSTGDGATVISNNAVTENKIANDSVTTNKILNNNVTTAKMADNAITVAKLPAGATSTTFLKGDGTWASPSLSFTESVLGSDQTTSTSPTSIVTISLAAGTWLINSSLQFETNGLNDTYTASIYNTTASSELVKGVKQVVYSAYNRITLSKIVTVGTTTSVALQVSSISGGKPIKATDTLINAIKIA